jgi:hypothetical protein
MTVHRKIVRDYSSDSSQSQMSEKDPFLTSHDDPLDKGLKVSQVSYDSTKPLQKTNLSSMSLEASQCVNNHEEPEILTGMFRAVDMLEDQVDDLAYEELVPLHLKLALEDRVFGSTNLFSSILGHIGITVTAYYLTYWALSYIPWQIYDDYTTRNLRLLFCIWVGFISYRIVRRRKHIWFRSAYGTKEYKQDELRRRIEVAETDASTLLGRILRRRDVYLKGRAMKKLSQAENRFESWKRKKDIRRRPSFQTFPANETKSIENDQVLFPCIHRMPYSHGCFFGAAPFLLANPDWISILRQLMPDVYVEISRRVLNAPTAKLIHWAENNPVVAAYGTANVLANTGKIVTLEWDVFLDPRLVRRVELVLNQRDTFLSLYSGMEKDAWSSEQKSIMSFLSEELDRRSQELVDKMLIAHGKVSHLFLEQTGHAKDYIYSRVARTRRTLGGGMYARQWMSVYAESLRLGMQMGQNLIAFKEDESVSTNSTVVSDDEGQMFESCMIADRLRRTESCPMLLQDTACLNADCIQPKESTGASRELTEQGSERSFISSNSLSSCPSTSLEESVELLKHVTKKARPIVLLLDMKSRHVPKRVWSLVIDTLASAGIRVEAVASFTVDEIRDISGLCRQPVLEIIYCHSAGELQQGCHNGLLRYGDTVFINGGSLLWEASEITISYLIDVIYGNFDPNYVMDQYNLLPFTSTKKGLSNTLKAYKERLNLHIGLYVQEFSIDEAALDILVRFVNENPILIEHGLSWGGINGVTVKGIRPSRYAPTDGLSAQRLVSISWDYTKSVLDIPCDFLTKSSQETNLLDHNLHSFKAQ